MQLFGDNSAYGTVRVDIDARRCVMPVDADSEPFPKGTGGLIPVICTNRRGGERTVYAFPSEPLDSDAGPLGRTAASALLACIDIANDVLDQASDLVRDDLGRLVCAAIEIPTEGMGFTHVERLGDADTAVTVPSCRLVIETSDEPGAAGTATCTIGFDAQGRPEHVAVVTHETAKTGVRISASWRHDLQGFKVMKVEELDGRLIYKAPVPKKRRR